MCIGATNQNQPVKKTTNIIKEPRNKGVLRHVLDWRKTNVEVTHGKNTRF